MTVTAQTSTRPNILLVIRPAERRYAVRHADLTDIRRVVQRHELDALGTPERPAVPVRLSDMLGESSDLPAHQALIVSLRRRPIVFLVHQIEMFVEQPVLEPLPDLIRRSLSEPWSTGVMQTEEGPAVVLDLRALARSVLTSAKALREE
jgi:hypothetical protein